MSDYCIFAHCFRPEVKKKCFFSRPGGILSNRRYLPIYMPFFILLTARADRHGDDFLLRIIKDHTLSRWTRRASWCL